MVQHGDVKKGVLYLLPFLGWKWKVCVLSRQCVGFICIDHTYRLFLWMQAPYPSIYLIYSIYSSLPLSISLTINLSSYQSIYQFINQSIVSILSVFACIDKRMNESIYNYISESIYLNHSEFCTCLFCLSVHLYLSICLHIASSAKLEIDRWW